MKNLNKYLMLHLFADKQSREDNKYVYLSYLSKFQLKKLLANKNKQPTRPKDIVFASVTRGHKFDPNQ